MITPANSTNTMPECYDENEEWMDEMGDNETVPVIVHLSQETAQKALCEYQHQQENNQEIDLSEYILNAISLDPTFFVDGLPIDEWKQS